MCLGTGPRFFFFSLPSLFSVTPHPSVSFSLASSVLTPRYAAAALTGSPRERGEGGSRAQSRGYPPACEGRWGYVASGAGPRAVGTEQGRWRRERTRPGILVCVLCAAVVRAAAHKTQTKIPGLVLSRLPLSSLLI